MSQNAAPAIDADHADEVVRHFWMPSGRSLCDVVPAIGGDDSAATVACRGCCTLARMFNSWVDELEERTGGKYDCGVDDSWELLKTTGWSRVMRDL